MQITLAQTLIGRIIPFEDDANRQPFASGIRSEDRFIQVEEGVIRWERRFTSNFPGSYPYSELPMELEVAFTPDYLMIPAVSYNGNRFGGGKDPLGFERDGQPYSFASHRVSVPACTFAQNDAWHIGLFADPREMECGVSGSIIEKDGKVKLALLAPEQEMPVIFAHPGHYTPGYRDTVFVSSDKPLVVVGYIVYGKRNPDLPGYAHLLDFAWKLFRHSVRPWFGEKALYDLALDYARNGLLVENEAGSFFNIGLSWNGRRWEHRPNDNPSSYETGWCGQNIGYANAMLWDYLRTGCEENRDIGLSVLDSWMKTRLPNGLMYVRFSPKALTDEEFASRIVLDSCNLGATIEYLIEAWELAQKCGTPRPEYREAALAICDFMVKAQMDNGNYPASFNNRGEVLQAEGNTGDFVISGMLWGYAVTGSEAYLASAKKGFDFYFGALRTLGYTTAGALDSYCVDKESAMPILSSALMLYKITKDPAYLKAAEFTAYYLNTWQWHHSVVFPKGTAMGDMDYDTMGGTAVSTEHNHIDAYALRYMSYLMVLGDMTGDPIWKDRAMAVWNNASIGVSDGSYVESGLSYPAGAQSEAFCYTRWGQAYQTSRWLVAWMGSFRLEVLRKTDFFTRPGMDDPIRV